MSDVKPMNMKGTTLRSQGYLRQNRGRPLTVRQLRQMERMYRRGLKVHHDGE